MKKWFSALALLSASAICSAQQPNITGLYLGMPLSRAKARLSAYKETPLQVTYLPGTEAFEFTKGTDGFGHAGDGYTLAALNGKLFSIVHLVVLPPSEAVDRAKYAQEIIAKYGQPSSPVNVQNFFMGNWYWNASGQLVDLSRLRGTEGDCNARMERIAWAPVPVGSGTGLDVVRGALQVPMNPGPTCFEHLAVSLSRYIDRVPPNAIDTVYISLTNPSLLFEPVKEAIARQQAAARARQNQTQQQSGPPM